MQGVARRRQATGQGPLLILTVVCQDAGMYLAGPVIGWWQRIDAIVPDPPLNGTRTLEIAHKVRTSVQVWAKPA